MITEKLDSSHGKIRNVFIFLLLSMFAACGMFIIVVGAGNYKTLVTRTETYRNDRIIDTVIRNAIIAGDSEGSISIAEADGISGNVLQISEKDDDGETVSKRFFCREGQLIESYTSGEEFNTDAGETICKLDGFNASAKDGILTVRLMNGDSERMLTIVPHTRMGGDAQ